MTHAFGQSPSTSRRYPALSITSLQQDQDEVVAGFSALWAQFSLNNFVLIFVGILRMSAAPVPPLLTGARSLTLVSVGFYEWARRLDDRVVVPADRKLPAWTKKPLARWGTSTAIIFGGGFIMRVVFRHQVHTANWALATYAVVGLVGVSMLLVAWYREKTRNRE